VTFEEAAKNLAAAGVESPRTEARLLYAHALGVRRDDTLSADLKPTPEQTAAFAAMVMRRIAREPFAYVTGAKEFWSLDFQVGPGVLVPRPETETLIEEALRVIPDRNTPLAVADLGTGSGALLIAALKEFPRAAGLGLDSSAEALGYARRNVFVHGLSERAKLKLDDWAAAPDDSFDLVFSNPPYIPSVEIESLDPEVSRFEPRAALDGGPDGLDAYRALALVLPRILKKGGWAILEIGAGQAVEPVFQGSGLRLAGITPDLGGIPRAVLLEKS
jgi:release factor glutamine methyltransferase